MKIAIVIKNYGPEYGGVERYAAQVVAHFANRGCTIDVYCMRHATSQIDSGKLPTVRWLKIDSPALGKVVRELLFILKVRRLLRRGSYDISFALTRSFSCNLYRLGGGLHRNWLREKYRFSQLSYLLSLLRPKNVLRIIVDRMIFAHSRDMWIVANSNRVRAELHQSYPMVDEERVKVIYNGVDNTRFSPAIRSESRRKIRKELGLSEDTFAVVFVGTDVKRKGLDLLLEALSPELVNTYHVKVIVVGGGTQAQRAVGKTVKRVLPGLEHAVCFVPHAERIERYYGAADCFCLPTRYDPFSNACLEAMACGIPVITTKQNGAAEIIVEGMNGFVVDSLTASAVREKLLLVLNHPSRKKLALCAAATAEQFTQESSMQQLSSFMQDIVRSS